MLQRLPTTLALMIYAVAAAPLNAQVYGEPDRGQPGDEMIQAYLRQETQKPHERFLQGVESLEDWNNRRQRYLGEYLFMLGLSPAPEKTPLKATITGTLEGDGYRVEMLHYQSLPSLYVTANLYRPAKIADGDRLPAVFYVCGHSYQGRNGNKTAYQSHGIWFARHGYICLMVDSLQLSEIAAIHHGTYRENRWWWHSRGYTPAGVECWNGVRGIDYLIDRPDVDPDRIAVTGISGGGAATFWIAAADERVKVAVPVSGMADLPSYVPNRVINGHCDCMFLYNSYRWPWTRIAALIAPRPLLFVNSDQDRIFPMDANERVIHRLERVYSLYGASDMVDSEVSIGGHAYRQDIRQAAYRFINMHLKDDPRIVTDSEVDLVTGPRNDRTYPIAPERLRVFPEDKDLPTDEKNTTIDETFVPLPRFRAPSKTECGFWKEALLAKLRDVTFRHFPQRIPAGRETGQAGASEVLLETEPGIRVPLRCPADLTPKDAPTRVLLAVADSDETLNGSSWVRGLRQDNEIVYLIAPRGIGPTRWTRKNPPNYVERSHVLLGRTVDTGRVWDIAAAYRYLREKYDDQVPVQLVGVGAGGILAVYAALWEDGIAEVTIKDPPLSHMDDGAPQLLNVLRVCDIPDVLGMLAPRPLTIQGKDLESLKKTAQIYEAFEASDKLVIEEP